jgi:hypothetical protein
MLANRAARAAVLGSVAWLGGCIVPSFARLDDAAPDDAAIDVAVAPDVAAADVAAIDAAVAPDGAGPSDAVGPTDVRDAATADRVDVVPPCTVPRMVCGGACVDTATDLRNCGTCGNACPTRGTCVAGRCSCPTTPSWICMDPRGMRTCTDLNEVQFCGACNVACAGGTPRCAGGRCTAP